MRTQTERVVQWLVATAEESILTALIIRGRFLHIQLSFLASFFNSLLGGVHGKNKKDANFLRGGEKEERGVVKCGGNALKTRIWGCEGVC